MEKNKFFHFSTGNGGFNCIEKEKVNKILAYMVNSKMDFFEYYKAIDKLYDGENRQALNTIFVSWQTRLMKKYENLKISMNI